MERSRWRAAAGLAAIGAWLTAKQLLGAPALPGRAPTAGALAASAGVALLALAAGAALRGRRRWLALAAIALVLALVHQVQLVYHRQFHELASVAALPYAPQTAAVAGAIAPLLRATDALLWVDVLVLVAAAWRAGPPAPPAPRSRRGRRRVAPALAGAGAGLLLVAAAPLLVRPLTGPRRLGIARAEVAAALNVVGYQVYDVATWARRQLDDAGPEALEAARAHHAGRPWARGPLSGVARGKNVIVVQVESLQAFAVGRRVEGVPVTPGLDRLAKESLVFANAYAQVGQGTTSDAELLAGCSLFPLETGAVFTERYDVDLRCLPERLGEVGYHTVALHANWPNFWNRDRMYPAMGIREYLSIHAFDRAPVVGLGLSDLRFAEQAAERLATLPEPFHAVLVTLSNHAPFDDPAIPRSLPLGPIAGTEVGGYLESVAFTDRALGILVDRLRASGLLDRSVLVVYGDHHGLRRDAGGVAALGLPEPRADGALRFEARVPLLVRLPGGRAAGVRGEPAGQVDVAPTLLDLLGIPPRDVFFHGRSLVSAPPAPVVLADGSAVTTSRVHLSAEGRWGSPGACLDAETGAPRPPVECEPLAAEAARTLAVARAEVNGDLLRWLVAPAAAQAGAGAARRPPPGATALFLGSSTTAGAGAGAEPRRWSSRLAARAGWREVNAGLAGSTLTEGAGPAASVEARWRGAAEGARPDVVFVMAGANDVLRGVPLGAPGEAGTFRDAAAAVIQGLRAAFPGATLVVVTPQPAQAIAGGRAPYDAALAEAAAASGAVLVRGEDAFPAGALAAYAADTLHLNDRGHAALAEHVAQALQAAGLLPPEASAAPPRRVERPRGAGSRGRLGRARAVRVRAARPRLPA